MLLCFKITFQYGIVLFHKAVMYELISFNERVKQKRAFLHHASRNWYNLFISKKISKNFEAELANSNILYHTSMKSFKKARVKS